MPYSVIRTDRVLAGRFGDLEHVVATVALDNGRVGVVGNLKAGEREIHEFVTPTDVTKQAVCLVATSELMTESYKGLADFVNPANKPIWVYRLHVGDVITVTDDAIDGATVNGQFVVPQNGSYKLAASATDTGTRILFKVIGKDETIDYAARPATQLRVVRVVNDEVV